MTTFVLHAQLAADTVALSDWPLCRVLLMNDQRYPWLVLVPRRAGASELIDLEVDDQAALWAEIDRASRTLKNLLKPDKLNVAALGNVVAQLHVHVLARFRNDAAWPKPVWGAVPVLPYGPADLAARCKSFRDALGMTESPGKAF